MFPAARRGDSTATGDMVIGPGVPNVFIGGMSAATVSDKVIGPVLNAGPGTITTGSATVFIGGLPAARLTSTVLGNTSTPGGPVPISTIIVAGCPTVLIGG